MSALVRFERFGYRYPLRERPLVEDFSMEIEAGERLLVVGESGSGKSTLLRAINGLVPHFYGGEISGRVVVAGLDTREVGPRDLSALVGFVFQDPESQFVVDRVEDELALAMENFALPPDLMRRRVEEVLDQLGIAHLRDRSVATLSGGEKQRVAIASVLTLRPRLLVLDEPTSQLDPEAAEEVLRAIQRLHVELGLTIVLAEHRLDRVLPHADRILWLPGQGVPPRVGPTREIVGSLPQLPPLAELGRALGWSPLPLTVEEALERAHALPVPRRAPDRDPEPPSTPPVIELDEIGVELDGQRVLDEISLTIRRGEFVALMGPNGSGKSTLLKLLVALLRPDRGTIRVAGRDIAGLDTQQIARDVGYVPQNPNALLFAETVYEEPLVTLRNHGIAEDDAPIAPGDLLDRLGLATVAASYPRDLSAGQRERVALAAVLVTRPGIILLDEPTRGLDMAQKERLMAQLQSWQREGATVVVVSHDVELVARYADRVLMLDGGRLVADGDAADVLAADKRFAPQMSRLFDGSGVLTVEELLAALDRETAG